MSRKETQQDRLLESLDEKKPARYQDLAKANGIGSKACRVYLGRLEAEGLVKEISENQWIRKGGEKGIFAVRCSRCGKVVSNKISEELVIRAWVECAECLQLPGVIGDSSIKPLGDRILLRIGPRPEGITIPCRPEPLNEAIVLAVGPEVKRAIKVGGSVLFAHYAGSEVWESESERWIIVKQSDISAILDAGR